MQTYFIICKNICPQKCEEFKNNKSSSLSSKNNKLTKSDSLPKINYNKCIDLSEELNKLNKKCSKKNDSSDEKSIFFNKKDYEKWVNKNNNGMIKREEYKKIDIADNFNGKKNSKKYSNRNSRKKSIKDNSRKKSIKDNSTNFDNNIQILNEIFNTMNYRI